VTVLATLVAVDESKVTPGLLGFVVVALLGVATYLLIRSMNRRIRNIDLPDEPGDEQKSRHDEPETQEDGPKAP
jgi:hypothetical protein